MSIKRITTEKQRENFKKKLLEADLLSKIEKRLLEIIKRVEKLENKK